MNVRPLFLYGTLRARPLLAWALTGDATKTDLVSDLVRPAYLVGYARYTVAGKDYPALLEDPYASTPVDGLLFTPQTASQRAKLDDFEGETYRIESVTVTVADDDGSGVEADVYVWNGDPEEVSREGWALDVFERERLEDWVGLFGGMRLVGLDDD